MMVDNTGLAWILFYILVAVTGIFLSLIYLVSRKPSK